MAVSKPFRVLDGFEVSGTANVSSTAYVGGVLTAAANVSISGMLSVANTASVRGLTVTTTANTQGLAVTNGTVTFGVIANTSNDSLNPLVDAGDVFIYTTKGTVNQGVLTIGTFANRGGGFGIRLDTMGYVVTVAADELNLSNTALSFSGSRGSAGQILYSNGSAGYWSNPPIDGVTSIATANGITGGTITSTGTIRAVGANGISVTSAGINVLAGTGIVANSSGVHVTNPTLRHASAGYTSGGRVFVSNTEPVGTFANGDIWIQI